MSNTKTYTLFLLKQAIADFEQVFTPTAAERVQAGEVQVFDGSGLGEEAKLYIFSNDPKPPTWLADVQSAFTGDCQIFCAL